MSKIPVNFSSSADPATDALYKLGYIEQFGVTGGNIVSLGIAQLELYPDNPWRIHSTERLQELASSISELGLMTPLVARLLPSGKYQILDGRNRYEACKLIQKNEVPCRVLRDVDDAAAAIIVAELNLRRRDEMLPSERAHAYHILVEGRKQKGLKSLPDEDDGEVTASNRRQVFRYQRLLHLVPELLNRVDEGTLPFLSGVDLSYISEEGQSIIERLLATGIIEAIPAAKAERLKALATAGIHIDEHSVIEVVKSEDDTTGSTVTTSSKEKPRGTDGKEIKPLTYAQFISQLSKGKFISAAQKRELTEMVRLAMESIEQATIREYLTGIGREETCDALLRSRYDKSDEH